MQSSSLLFPFHFHHNITPSSHPNCHHFLGTLTSTKSLFHSVFFPNFSNRNPAEKISPIQSHSPPPNHKKGSKGNHGTIRAKGNKENVWSVDNELAKAEKERERDKRRASTRKPKGRRVMRRKRNKGDPILVSGAMLMEVETVLQTQEPVIKPAWNTFTSSVSGIWKGVGAVFSPITAKMEPIEIGNNNEHVYDCYTLSCIEAEPSLSGEQTTQIRRKVNWVTLNPYGETVLNNGDASSSLEPERSVGESVKNYHLPKFESFNFDKSDVLEEDVMGNEPGLVFFEDGSYSRGPISIPVGEVDDTKYYVNPTFKFEQCVVKGCDRRVRIVHTIEFRNGGAELETLRVAVYEEQWMGPSSSYVSSEEELKPLSQRKRTQPRELSGSWKVYEVSATPVAVAVEAVAVAVDVAYVYLCTETVKKRSLPEAEEEGGNVYFGEEELMDMDDGCKVMMWLPGGVTAYVDVSKDGILCIGVGWYSPEGINLVMERDYDGSRDGAFGVGSLKEVRSKSELKRRWPLPPL